MKEISRKRPAALFADMPKWYVCIGNYESQDVIQLRFLIALSFGLSQYLKQGFREQGFLAKSYLALTQQLFSSAPVPNPAQNRQFTCQGPALGLRMAVHPHVLAFV